MRVLINATTLVVGGGVQVAASLIDFAMQNKADSELEFRFAVSTPVLEDLRQDLRRDTRVVHIPVSPARVIGGRASRSMLRKLEMDFQPHVVYSVGSPSYMRFRATEIARFTWPWGTHPSPLAWSLLPPHRRLVRWLEVRYKLWHLRNVKYFETQTATAARGIARQFPNALVRTVPNAYAPVFEAPGLCASRDQGTSTVELLTVAAPYPHKNLMIIPRVAAILKEIGGATHYRFVVTLPEGSNVTRKFMAAARSLNVGDLIENVGRVPLRDCPLLYRRCQAVFLPSVLETFSVTYLEAMQMERPIITADTEFARDICNDAALYFSPLSAQSAAAEIVRVSHDLSLRDQQIANGKRRLESYLKPGEKYAMVIDLIREIAEKQLGQAAGRDGEVATH